ncbi:hypothetical protein V6N11_031447 [Hibiscus sabdariffa]|uniref:Uncharacterized protein n=1 Tax=Hibiscus sabdariffa TaxID=183260 RepID=A0ABR2SYG5_9ROSI
MPEPSSAAAGKEADDVTPAKFMLPRLWNGDASTNVQRSSFGRSSEVVEPLFNASRSVGVQSQQPSSSGPVDVAAPSTGVEAPSANLVDAGVEVFIRGSRSAPIVYKRKAKSMVGGQNLCCQPVQVVSEVHSPVQSVPAEVYPPVRFVPARPDCSSSLSDHGISANRQSGCTPSVSSSYQQTDCVPSVSADQTAHDSSAKSDTNGGASKEASDATSSIPYTDQEEKKERIAGGILELVMF